jgi:hypothetical protein
LTFFGFSQVNYKSVLEEEEEEEEESGRRRRWHWLSLSQNLQSELTVAQALHIESTLSSAACVIKYK